MNKDINQIAATIKGYQETGEKDRAKALEQTATTKLKNKVGLNKASREVSRLRKEVRKVMENRLMDRDAKREKLDNLNRKINQLSATAVKRYQE